MSAYTIGRTVIVYKDSYAYISHPSVAVLDTGEWIVAFKNPNLDLMGYSVSGAKAGRR